MKPDHEKKVRVVKPYDDESHTEQFHRNESLPATKTGNPNQSRRYVASV